MTIKCCHPCHFRENHGHELPPVSQMRIEEAEWQAQQHKTINSRAAKSNLSVWFQNPCSLCRPPLCWTSQEVFIQPDGHSRGSAHCLFLPSTVSPWNWKKFTWSQKSEKRLLLLLRLVTTPSHSRSVSNGNSTVEELTKYLTVLNFKYFDCMDSSNTPESAMNYVIFWSRLWVRKEGLGRKVKYPVRRDTTVK